MSSVFKTIVSGRAPDWALEVASPRDFGVMTRPDHPAVAFSMLNFSPAALGYIDSLDYRRDFLNHRYNLGGFGADLYMNVFFNVAGWHKDPDLSVEARALFEGRATRFFPKGDGRRDMLETLSSGFAGAASAIDRSALRFRLVAIHNDPKFDIHEDDGEKFTVGVNIREKASLIFPPGSWQPKARKSVFNPDGDDAVKYDPSLCDLGQAMHLPQHSMSVWTENQPHAPVPGHNMTRIGVFAFASNRSTSSALPDNPSRWMRFRTFWNNKVLG